MSGASGSYNPPKAGGIILPVPKVQLYKPAAPADIFVADQFPSFANPMLITTLRQCKVTVAGMSQAILDDPAKYQPLIELLRYTRLNSRENASGGNGTKSSGYVHPSHGPAASGSGSFTHGGAHGGVAATIQAIRPTEWPFIGGQAVDVTQGIFGFFAYVPLDYRDAVNGPQGIKLLCPTAALTRKAKPGRRFPYSRMFSPGYFAFRVSVIDPTDKRGKRIHGPVSQVVQASNAQFPFVPAGLDANGMAQANIMAGFNDTLANITFATRVPQT